MASIEQQIELLPQVVSDTRTTNYLTLAAFVVFLYDWFLTFSREREFFWEARWTTGKVLFLLNRYLVLLISVFLLAYMFDYSSPFDFCVASNYVEAWSMLVFIIPVQVILILRTLALWGQNRKIFILLVVTLVAADSTIIVSISLITTSLSFENRQIVKPILGCFGQLNDVTTSKAIPSWIALMIFDTIVFLLTLYRVRGMRKAKNDQSIFLHILFRDGIIFYLIMLASSIANLTIYAALPYNRRGLIISLIPLLRTVMSVCTARLLLNLRSAAVDHGRSAQHWALGELEVEPDRSTTYLSRSAAALSSTTTAHSFSATTSRNAAKDADVEAWKSDFGYDGDSRSRRSPNVVSVRREEEQYRDDSFVVVPQASSFERSVLTELANVADAQSNIELQVLRSNTGVAR